ncbi:MAG: methyltransferase [Candidatus Hodarchaeales archaeon]|jgi:predicted O-methyltransferase YrrM
MKLETTDDVKNMLRMYIPSAALGAAMELQLFWQLAKKPSDVEEVSHLLNIPLDRCRCWLELLVGFNLLEYRNGTYAPSAVARSAILENYSADSWAHFAQEMRERYQAGENLALHITHPESVWKSQGIEPPDWFAQIVESPKRAERFTRMLFDLHSQFAKQLAQRLDMTNVRQLMDLGGGSGVVSLALLKRHPDLKAVVVDIDNVCDVGREIADKTPMADRITYHAADFLRDDLPTGFDMILECDVGIYTEELFRKLRGILNEGGRLVIVTNLDGLSAWLTKTGKKPPLDRLMNVFLGSLGSPKLATTSIQDVKKPLTNAGFQNVSEQVWDDGTVLIQAIEQ